MKISKKAHNVSDNNDKEICVFRFKDIKKYVVNLKSYQYIKKNDLTVYESAAITGEVRAWENFFNMMDKLNIKTK